MDIAACRPRSDRKSTQELCWKHISLTNIQTIAAYHVDNAKKVSINSELSFKSNYLLFYRWTQMCHDGWHLTNGVFYDERILRFESADSTLMRHIVRTKSLWHQWVAPLNLIFPRWLGLFPSCQKFWLKTETLRSYKIALKNHHFRVKNKPIFGH